jgi:hypothetical protein
MPNKNIVIGLLILISVGVILTIWLSSQFRLSFCPDILLVFDNSKEECIEDAKHLEERYKGCKYQHFCETLEELIRSEPIDTSNWKIYRNEKYGFEIKYPESWQIDEYNPGRQENTPEERTIVITFFSPQRKSIDEDTVEIFVMPSLYEENWEETWERSLWADLEEEYLIEKGVSKKYEEDKTEDKREYFNFLQETVKYFRENLRKKGLSFFCKNEELSIKNIEDLFKEGKIKAYCFTRKKLYLITDFKSYFSFYYKGEKTREIFNQMLSTFKIIK